MTHPIPQRLTPPDISPRAIAKLAGPIFVANIAIVGGGTIDTMMAGHLGADHLAAIALGLASMIMVFMGLVGILQGMSPLAGHHFGAKRYEQIGFELSQCLWLALALCFVGMPLLGCTDIWTNLAQAQGPVKEMAATYLLVSMCGLPAALGGRAFVSLNAAVSRPKVTMYVSLAMVALKAPLNAVFMYGWFGFDAMGGAGAAVSSTILSWLSFFAYILVWKRDAFYDRMRCSKFYWPQPKAMWAQLNIHLFRSEFIHPYGNLYFPIWCRYGVGSPNRGQRHKHVLHDSALFRDCLYRFSLSVFGCRLGQCRGKSHPALSFNRFWHSSLYGCLSLFRARFHSSALHIRCHRDWYCLFIDFVRCALSRFRCHAVRQCFRPSRLSSNILAHGHLWCDALVRGTFRRLLHGLLWGTIHARARRLRLLGYDRFRLILRGNVASGHGALRF